jgi:hypothetical protein
MIAVAAGYLLTTAGCRTGAGARWGTVATSPRHVVIANGWSRSVVSRVPQTREASVRRCSIICVGRPADRSASRRSHRANKVVRSARLTTVDLRRPHLLFAAAERRNVVRPERRFLGREGLVEFCPKRVFLGIARTRYAARRSRRCAGWAEARSAVPTSAGRGGDAFIFPCRETTANEQQRPRDRFGAGGTRNDVAWVSRIPPYASRACSHGVAAVRSVP